MADMTAIRDIRTRPQVGSEIVERSFMGRRRSVALAGATMVAFASQVFFPETSQAAAAPPNGCFGYDGCPCCSGTSCCSSGCSGCSNCGCPTGGQCWYSCAYIGSTLYRIRCCDYRRGSGYCICRGILGSC